MTYPLVVVVLSASAPELPLLRLLGKDLGFTSVSLGSFPFKKDTEVYPLPSILESPSPAQQKFLNETPQDIIIGDWTPTTPEEIRAWNLGLEEFAPRISNCGKYTIWGIHPTEDKWHKHSENRSRCSGGPACRSCTSAYASRIAARWSPMSMLLPPEVEWLQRIDFSVPCNVGKLSKLDRGNRDAMQAIIRAVKSKVVLALKRLDPAAALSILWVWNYDDSGYLSFSWLYAGSLDERVLSQLYQRLSFSKHPKGALLEVVREILAQHPNSLKGVRGVELKALFHSMQRIESWGTCKSKLKEHYESLGLTLETEGEVCSMDDPNTNFNGVMTCWCGAKCTHMMAAGPTPPPISEILQWPVPPKDPAGG